jgi:transposase
MDTIGLDLHKRESQLCIGHTDGTISDRRIVTSRERFTGVLGGRPPARMLLEAGTESEWAARHLESLGHEVIVADPNFAPMYATRSRRVKTDKRDARTLMEACRLGAYRPAHRLSEARRHVRAELGCGRRWAPRWRAAQRVHASFRSCLLLRARGAPRRVLRARRPDQRPARRAPEDQEARSRARSARRASSCESAREQTGTECAAERCPRHHMMWFRKPAISHQ